MKGDSDCIDWSLTAWERGRREQMRRWSELTMDEILEAHEEMADLTEQLHVADDAEVREEPPLI